MKELIMGNHGWKYIKYVLIREWLKENLEQAFVSVRKAKALIDEMSEIENILKNLDTNKLNSNTIDNILDVIKTLKQKAETIKFKIKQKPLYKHHKKNLACSLLSIEVLIKKLEKNVKMIRDFTNKDFENLATQLKDKYEKNFHVLQDRIQKVNKETDALKKRFEKLDEIAKEKTPNLAKNATGKIKSSDKQQRNKSLLKIASSIDVKIKNIKRKALLKGKIEEKKKRLEDLKMQQLDLHAKIRGLTL